ncbi:MAG: efflux RND transporter periplasmic adaptor subunit [Acidobacteria bacterium]|nr:efflux RND transporter periplasmic adaptor subunit [Acidobacteriota bacterium]
MIRMNRVPPTLAFSLALALLGCGGRTHGAPVSTPAPGREPTATVGVVRIQRGTVEEAVRTFGTVAFDPHQVRTVSFITAGQVAQVLVTTGQSIGRGEALLKLGPLPSSSLEAEQARINLDYAQRNLERLRRLRESHLATNEAVQQAEKDVASARAALEGIGIDDAHGPRTIEAPFSGVVVKVLVTSGSIVHPGEDAVLVAPAGGLVVRCGFEPEDAARLKPEMEAWISPVFTADGTVPVKGVLMRTHRMVNPRTQLLEALIRPKRIPAWMVAGARVQIRVVVRAARAAVRVPRNALVTWGGITGVFEVVSGHARWRPVQTGVAGEHWVEIKGGLRAGALVATTGRTSLNDGMAVNAVAQPGT